MVYMFVVTTGEENECKESWEDGVCKDKKATGRCQENLGELSGLGIFQGIISLLEVHLSMVLRVVLTLKLI